MDFKKCLDILDDRRRRGHAHEEDTEVASCPCLSDLNAQHKTLQSELRNSSGADEDFEMTKSLSVLELIDKILKLQEERVMVYKEYNKSLSEILKDGRIAEYSLLCAEVTARFQAISKVIKNIQVSSSFCLDRCMINIYQTELLSRKDSAAIGASVQRLQQQESEKLVIVAAEHMELIKQQYPAFVKHMGGEKNDVDLSHLSYTNKKRLECENRISEEITNLMSEKCDLVE